MIDGFRGRYFFLSNFYMIDVYYKGKLFITSEHAYIYAKTGIDYNHLSPNHAKIESAKDKVILPKRYLLREMENILIEKFKSEDLKRELLSIKEPIIENNMWHDNYWGNCMCIKCENIKGENNLGKILEKIKNNLQG